MKRDHAYHIWPRDLDFPLAFRAIEEFALKRGFKWSEKQYHEYSITFDRYESAHPECFDEFLGALKRASRFEQFYCNFQFCDSTNTRILSLFVFYRPSSIEVHINGVDDDTIIAAHDFIRREWRLSNPPIHVCQDGRPRNLQATIFLGKHFDTASEEPARTLRRFLELLRFDVQEADEYRALPIPEKVQRLIERQDIYIGLVTGRREHSWLTAEAAFAQGRNRHVIMVVEKGSDFNPTIQGRDYEQIVFAEGAVERAFIKILEEFRSLGISGL